MAHGSFNRAEALRRLRSTKFDVVVVGGGLTGCGVAVDAAARGLRTALLEKSDFGAGQSSRSSKLALGSAGLGRLDPRAVAMGTRGEAGRERDRLRRNAPHLVADLPVVVPVLDGRRAPGRSVGRWFERWLPVDRLPLRPEHRRLWPVEVLAVAPTLQPGGLLFGHLVHEAWADDARLTLALARTAAVDLGAAVANRAEVVSISRNTRGDLVGVRVQPAGQRTFQVATRSVVIAAGSGAAGVGGLPSRTEDSAAGSRGSHLARGVFVSVPRHRLPVDVAFVVPSRDGLGGPVLVVPWAAHTYLGAIRPASGDARDAGRCCRDDAQYLLGTVNASFAAGLVATDISGAWAGADEGGGRSPGVRTLPRRSHPIVHHNRSMVCRARSVADGLVAVSGGRLTTYRRVAADAVDAIVAQLDDRTKVRVRRRSRTKQLPLRGAVGWKDVRDGIDLGRPWPDTMLHHLAGRYGSEARTVLAMVHHEPDLGRPLVEGLPYLRAEALYAVRYEMAGSLTDVLERRTRARLVDREATAQAALDCAELIGAELGWDAHRRAAEVFGLLDDLARDRAALSSSTADVDAT